MLLEIHHTTRKLSKLYHLRRTFTKCGNSIDFYLSSTRNTSAAKRFLSKALKSIPQSYHPSNINTDKHPAYATIKGFEIMRMFKKGRFDLWKYRQGIQGEIRIIMDNLLAA